MPKGTPHEWTLAELQTIWEFDGDDGQTTVTDAARGMGITHSHWYGMRARLQEAGGPDQLFERMQESKRHRYNRTSEGKKRSATKSPDTIADSVSRVYVIVVCGSGRGGGQEQFKVTIPPLLAQAFIAAHGQQVTWEPTDEGLLLKPMPKAELRIPEWLAAAAASPPTLVHVKPDVLEMLNAAQGDAE